MSVAPSAPAERIAIVRDGAVSQARLDAGGSFELLADGVAGIAYDRDGRLWLTRPGEDEFDSCTIAPADGVTAEFGPGPLARQMLASTAVGGVDCDIATDPRGGLLFGGSNRTLGSASTWRLDTDTGLVSLVSWGYSPAPSADGARIAVIKHVYRRRGGADERLSVGALGMPRSVRPAAWARSGWSAPSFAFDGRLAAVRWTPKGSQLLVGPGGPPWRVAWARGKAITISFTAWSRAGDLFVLVHRIAADGGTLYRLAGGKLPALLFAQGVSTFALGPDQVTALAPS